MNWRPLTNLTDSGKITSLLFSFSSKSHRSWLPSLLSSERRRKSRNVRNCGGSWMNSDFRRHQPSRITGMRSSSLTAATITTTTFTRRMKSQQQPLLTELRATPGSNDTAVFLLSSVFCWFTDVNQCREQEGYGPSAIIIFKDFKFFFFFKSLCKTKSKCYFLLLKDNIFSVCKSILDVKCGYSKCDHIYCS